jgi:hypothetical protein
MKNSIYDRIPVITTADLVELKSIWSRLVQRRISTPRHDYHGKCLMRCTIELERRAVRDGSSPADGQSAVVTKES